MNIDIRPASLSEVAAVSEVLCAAAARFEKLGIPPWSQSDLRPDAIKSDAEKGVFMWAFHGDTPAGTLQYQSENPVFRPDAIFGEAS